MFFYITFVNLNGAGSVGIRKKVIGQCKAFEERLGRTYYTLYTYEVAYLMHEEEVVETEAAVNRKEYMEVLEKWLEKYKIKQTYIRYELCDKYMVSFFRWQKENGIRTVLEIPTYPYDGEIAYGRKKVEDEIYRKQVPAYIDTIVTYSEHKEIWGRKCICITNGIDKDEIALSKKTPKEKLISMVAASGTFCSWHGFERLIIGMKNYKENCGEYKFKLYLAGRKGDEELYHQLVKEFGLDEEVLFTGWLNKVELAEVFNKADIAISTLAPYKAGIDAASPLKGVEYCAKGMPMVCGYKDLRFPKDYPYILQVSNDDSPLDMEEVISFWERVKSDLNFREQICKFAQDNLSWDSVMKQVIDLYDQE